MSTSTTVENRPMGRAAATRAVRASLTWDAGTPSEERACARSEAEFWIRHHLNDRAEFLRIIEALDRGPVDFLAEMQRTAPFKDEPAAGSASRSSSVFYSARHRVASRGRTVASSWRRSPRPAHTPARPTDKYTPIVRY